MIRREELLRISRLTRMKPHQQEKHYIQMLMLRSIFSKFNPVFKGGTAMMFFRGLNRFSEDLDFTATDVFNPQEMLNTVSGDLEYMGVSNSVRVISDKDITFSFRIGARGPLFSKEIERSFVRVEISRREEVNLPSEAIFTEPVYPDQLPFSVNVMDPIEVLAEKVRAILTRNKARDVYDAWFLAGKEVTMDIDLVNKKLEYYSMKFERKELVGALEDKKDIWRSELSPIIFGPLPDFNHAKEGILALL